MKLREELTAIAISAMKNAYSPYSGYSVGAALETSDGRIFTGCNIENASYGATNCAERTALFKGVSEGCRSFTQIAVVGGKDGRLQTYAAPCGICRQVMLEFCGADFPIHLYNGSEYRTVTLSELLPFSFTAENIR